MAKSRHSLSHTHRTTADMGILYPVYTEEILPGDVFRHRTRAFIRANALVRPLLHQMMADFYTFYVPSRIMWPDFEAFILGNDRTLSIPQLTFPGGQTFETDNVAQRMGASPHAGKTINKLPLLAYHLIWNEHFRNDDIEDEVDVLSMSDADLLGFRRAMWNQDYFTSAKLETQEGDAITLGFSGDLPIKGIGVTEGNLDSPWASASQRNTHGYNPLGSNFTYYKDGVQSGDDQVIETATDEDLSNARQYERFIDGFRSVIELQQFGDEAKPNIRASIDHLGINILDLRKSFALQNLFERRARVGDKYEDYLSLFGVKGMDARLQNPEFVSKSSGKFAFSEVLATDYGSDGANLGKLAGHGYGMVKSRPYKRFFPEHGYLITLLCIKPKATYYGTTNKMFLKRRYDEFYQQELEHIGPQAIVKREIIETGGDDDIFAYSPRYDEYRSKPDFITGELVKDAYEPWHLGRKFANAPNLNASFITCSPSDRVFQSQLDPQFVVDMAHDISAVRPVGRRKY